MFDYDDNKVYTIVNTRACLDDQALRETKKYKL